MIQEYLLDIGLAAVLLITVACFFMLQLSSRLQQQPSEELAMPLGGPESTFSVYPARLIRQCGLPVLRTRILYWSVKAFSSLGALLAVTETGYLAISSVQAIIFVLMAFFLTDIWLLWKRKSRQNNIQRSLEFFINLMTVYLESGFSLNQAFRKAADVGLGAGRANPLNEEIVLIADELDAGRDRNNAFENLADRTGVEALRKLAVLVQTGLAAGAPIMEGLLANAELLKLQQQQRDTQRINRKSFETMIPVMMISFPMFGLLIFFPAGMQLLQVMKAVGDIFS